MALGKPCSIRLSYGDQSGNADYDVDRGLPAGKRVLLAAGLVNGELRGRLLAGKELPVGADVRVLDGGAVDAGDGVASLVLESELHAGRYDSETSISGSGSPGPGFSVSNGGSRSATMACRWSRDGPLAAGIAVALHGGCHPLVGVVDHSVAALGGALIVLPQLWALWSRD